MRDIKIRDIEEITLSEAYSIFKVLKCGFIIKDGKLKGFTK
ncbi:hypothetical protein CDFC105_43265 [Clostridioides difficile]|nr:hypothetical protein CDFC105_43265 [Clostridioides difficile]CZT60451.1 hypothetical protein CDFC105_103310 [Clostridioides difficile]